MAITRDRLLRELDLSESEKATNRKEQLFHRTGVWTVSKSKAANNYQSVAPVTARIQSLGVDLSHLREPFTVRP